MSMITEELRAVLSREEMETIKEYYESEDE